MNHYHEHILERILSDITRQHAAKADVSAIAACDPRLITAYDTKDRVRVENVKYGYTRTGTVSRTTGWQPALVLMARSNQRGSSDVLGPNDRVVAVKYAHKYVAV